jgi:hypothetical protein
MESISVAELNALHHPIRRKRTNQREEREHIELANTIRMRAVAGMVWWHTPNGGARNAITGSKLKQMGTRRGFPDLCFLHDGQLYALEYKPEKLGTVSAEQKACMAALEAAGAVCAVARGVKQAIETVEEWGLIKKQNAP